MRKQVEQVLISGYDSAPDSDAGPQSWHREE